MPFDVFISHSAKDKAIAEITCAWLERNGIRCWMAPRDIQAGTSWGAAIIKGIREVKVMVLLLSKYSNDSPQVIREVERAVNLRVELISVRIEDIHPGDDLEYFLSITHWLDAFKEGQVDYLTKLTDSIKKLLAQSKLVGAPSPLAAPKEPVKPEPISLEALYDSVFTLGAKIDRFIITEKIADYGSIKYYRANDPHSREQVIIKTFLIQFNAAGIISFKSAAHFLFGTKHPNIVSVLSLGETRGIPWLILEDNEGLEEGRDLQTFLNEENTLSLEAAQGFIRQICPALARATNIVPSILLSRTKYHLNLTPAKFLRDRNRFLLADMGMEIRMAALMGSGSDALAHPGYTGPEYFLEGLADDRTDIYAFGVILFELLTGEAPYTSTNKEDLAHMHASFPFPIHILNRKHIPLPWCNILKKMMAKRREERFDDFTDLLVQSEILLKPLPKETVIHFAQPVPMPPLPGRRNKPRSGGSSEMLFGLLPQAYEAKELVPMKAGKTMETILNRWETLRLNRLAPLFLALQTPAGERIDEIQATMRSVPRFQAIIDVLSTFLGKLSDFKPESSQDKIELIGVDRCRDLALVSLALSSDWQRYRGFNYSQFWEHSIYTGFLAGFMVDMLGIKPTGLEFVSGLVHDIGKLVFMESFPDHTILAWKDAYNNNQPLERSEMTWLGTTHHIVGRDWLQKHKFKQSVASVAEYHASSSCNEPESVYKWGAAAGDSPTIVKPEVHFLILVTCCANNLCNELGFGYSGNPAADEKPWRDQIQTRMLFDLKTAPNVTYSQFTDFFKVTCAGLPEIPGISMTRKEATQSLTN